MIVGFSSRFSNHVALSKLFAQYNFEYQSIHDLVASVFPGVDLDVFEMLQQGLPFAALDAITIAHPHTAVFTLHDNLDWGNVIVQLSVNPATSYMTLIGITFEPLSSNLSNRYLDLGIQEIHAFGELKLLVGEGALLFQRFQWEWDQPGNLRLPKDVHNAILLMNSGEYYRAHDALEEAWKESEYPMKILYRALLQACIAYYQVERNNYRGAIKTILRFRKWAEMLPDVSMGVNIAKLKSDIESIFRLIKNVGPEGVSGLASEIQQVEFCDFPPDD